MFPFSIIKSEFCWDILASEGSLLKNLCSFCLCVLVKISQIFYPVEIAFLTGDGRYKQIPDEDDARKYRHVTRTAEPDHTEGTLFTSLFENLIKGDIHKTPIGFSSILQCTGTISKNPYLDTVLIYILSLMEYKMLKKL